MTRMTTLCLFFLLACVCLQAEEMVYQDSQGTIRWSQTGQAIQIFGANYCLPSACDFRAASYVDADRDAMIAEDLDHFRRMGWEGLRLCFWGDWQNTDSLGNLIENEHLRLLDKLIAECSERDIYMLLSPIVTYDSRWPEMTDSINGLFNIFTKEDLVLNPEAIEAEKNYIKQLLNHTNRYTGRRIKDEPHILFIEICNEPAQFPDKPKEMTAYINGMADAIKSTGCRKLLFYNVSQNFEVSPIVASSKVDGGSYAWYPQGLISYRTIEGNPLLCVDRYPQLMDPMMDGKSKIVYEFDSTQRFGGLQTAAMVREFVRGGCQFIAMFSYDMLRTASRNLGWDVQFTNMVYTPRKAVASMIGAEMMRRWPKGEKNEFYPANNIFGDFRLSYEEDLALLNSEDSYYHTNNVNDRPKHIESLRHIAGVGSSPMVSHNGNGIYFLDKNKDDTWTLELYPDIIAVADPYNKPSPYHEVAIADASPRDFTVNLPDLACSGEIYPGRYTITPDGFIRIADHPAQDLYSEYKGWPSSGAHQSVPDIWDHKDWYATVETTAETEHLITVLNAKEGLKPIDYSRNFESPECHIRLISTAPDMNNAYELKSPDLRMNPEWRTDADVTLQRNIVDKLLTQRGKTPKQVRIWAKGLNGTDKALVNFMDKDGHTIGSVFPLSDKMRMIELDVAGFKSYPAVVLPQDWPGVCSYYYPQSLCKSTVSPSWDNMEQVQISLRGDLYVESERDNKGIVIEKVVLEY